MNTTKAMSGLDINFGYVQDAGMPLLKSDIQDGGWKMKMVALEDMKLNIILPDDTVILNQNSLCNYPSSLRVFTKRYFVQSIITR